MTLYYQSIKEMAAGPLLKVSFAWSLFYMIGMMALLILGVAIFDSIASKRSHG